MEKRLTIALCFDDVSNKKIDKFISDNGGENFCKVPYHTKDRIKNDTFPYHITLGSYKYENLDYIKQKFAMLKFQNFELEFVTDVWEFSEENLNGKILFLRPTNSKKIKSIENQIYQFFSSDKEKFNPKNFNPHCTLNIDCDIKKIENFYERSNGIAIKLKLESICLFENYPAKLLCKIN